MTTYKEHESLRKLNYVKQHGHHEMCNPSEKLASSEC